MIDLDIDELEKLCKYEIGRGTANPYTVNGNPIHAMLEIITRLRQAEKDAARYRWLRDGAADADQTSPLVFMADECADIVTDGDYQGIMFGKLLDAAIDEAMQCK